MNKAKQLLNEHRAYMAWVDQIDTGAREDANEDAFVLLDLLHPDEVENLRNGMTFSQLVERPFENGIKTLPVVLRYADMKPGWRQAIDSAARNPESALIVGLNDTPGDDTAPAEIALRAAADDAQPALPVHIGFIGTAPAALSRRVRTGLSTVAYRKSVARSAAGGPGKTPRGKALLREILEWRVGGKDQVFAAVYDIGQGSAGALVDRNEHPLVFFDIGKPISVYDYTRPKHAPRFFHCDQQKMIDESGWLHAPVVLSHWDFDHWAGILERFYVVTDDKGNKYARLTIVPDALQRFWIAPCQEHLGLGATHLELIRLLLKTVNGASGLTALQYWPINLATLPFSHGVIVKAQPDADVGNTSSELRNNSGLVMLVTPTTERLADEGVDKPTALLLQGDARCESIPVDWSSFDLVGLVVSHHGGKMGLAPSAPAGGPHSKVVCSVGDIHPVHKTKPYGHPHPDALAAHAKAGWDVKTFTYQRIQPLTSDKKLGNYVLSLDGAFPQCGCDCASDGNLSLNPVL
ncbi:MAG: hypothetical protein GAK33_02239 [Burkholderia lata]|uniref:Uncharacterized protein n=1 Tax=Burkholderia lata (strain ATCC 17760 / DSM 23089 / LMG 22485 / NCIMB 9086 / R18194 / 383) TaxID=482957 RepID=A0A833PST2_BURL3|nr:hypothetical protein [Burkholderia lata]KAF1038903.1 MAG: hypothetical protein GAK33_02239 [Burkholderia lata]